LTVQLPKVEDIAAQSQTSDEVSSSPVTLLPIAGKKKLSLRYKIILGGYIYKE